MRPLALELAGFTSFRTATTVDFSELDLFAINGPTGSGKTSLLDAMIYALYGRAPRLNKEINQLISRGLRIMRVRFDFSVGRASYRIVRSSALRGKSVVTKTALEEITRESSKSIAVNASEVEAEVERLIGLDYESFIRSVVLPQGEFDGFLKGEPKERQKILHHLLRMGIYRRMQELASQRAAGHALESKLLATKLQELAGATPEALAESRASLAELETRTNALAAAIGELEEAETQVRSLVQVLSEVAEAEREAERIAADRAAAERELADSTRRGEAGERALAELEERLAASTHDETRYLALEKAEKDADSLVAAEAARKRAMAEETEAAHRIERLRAELEATLPRLKDLASRQAAAGEALDRARAPLAALVERWQSPALLATHIALEESRQKTRALIAERERAKQAAEQEIEKRREAVASARRAEAEARARREETHAALESALEAHSAGELRKKLRRGEPCPVCEQLVSSAPRPPRTQAVARARAAHEEAGRKADRSAQEAAQAAARLEADEASVKALARELARLAGEEDSAAAKLEDYLGTAPGDATLEELLGGVSDFQAADEAARASEEEEKAVGDEAERVRQERTGLEAALDSSRAVHAERRKKLDETERSIAELHTRLTGVVGEVPDLAAQVRVALDNARRIKSEREKLLKEKENETRGLAAAREDAVRARTALAAIATQETGNAERRRRNAERAKQERTKITRGLKKLGVELSESADGRTEERELGARRAARVKERLDLEGTRALASKAVRELEAEIERREATAEEMSQVDHREGIARTLAGDLAVNHFVAYLLEEALEVLAADANRHLRAFPAASFSLAVDGQGFAVVDHANADERRSVKTLSGGESFAASLALAIAFAETLATLAGGEGAPTALESLFLDEGFGTLDAEHLDAVAGAIESLYGQDRTVGIITHIPELAERLPARIIVSKTGNTSQAQVEMV